MKESTEDPPAPAGSTTPPLSWFEGYGIELEYMVVDATSLNVMPIVPALLDELTQATSADGNTSAPLEGSVAMGPIAWSNELAAHVIEIKTNGPAPNLGTVATDFARALQAMNKRLTKHGACLLPTGMHPWMEPDHEFTLYPVDDEGYYKAFDRIFDCRGHGWSNLQSMHINLPFSSDEQFAKLHSAVRLLLPLLPALAASSPFQEGRHLGRVDERLFVYRTNARRVPAVSGQVVPEHVTSRAHYEGHILGKIYADLAPLDPEGILHYEWVNARGAIARFDRMALEIRVLDAQECPRADLAIAGLITEALRQLSTQPNIQELSAEWSETALAEILWQVATHGSQSPLDSQEYLKIWDAPKDTCCAGELWQHILARLPEPVQGATLLRDASLILEHGTLSERLLRQLGTDPTRSELTRTYRMLRRCLNDNAFFSVE